MLRQLAVRLTIALALSAASLGAAVPRNETTIPLPGLYIAGLAAAPDGTLWYGALETGGTIVGFVRPDGTGDRVLIPHPFGNENRVVMLALSDGSVMVGSYNGLIARVDPQLHVTLIQRPQLALITDFAVGPDGNVWYATNSVFVGTITPAGDLHEFTLQAPQSQSLLSGFAMTRAANAVYLAARDGIYRSTTPGTVERVASCSCHSRWIEVTEDGTIWTSAGYVRPGDDFVTTWPLGEAATLGPDGNVWIAGPYNMVRAIDGAGSIRELPLRTAADSPRAIVSARGSLWYGVQGEIRRLDPAMEVDLGLRIGDIVTHEEEPNCCFEGSHPVLAYYRRGVEPFVRRVQPRSTEEPSITYPASVYVVHPGLVLVEEYGTSLAALLDRIGEVSGRLAAPSGSQPGGLVLDRTGTLHAIRNPAGICRLMTVSASGALLRDIACPIESTTRIQAIDLAADQCTLFYAGRNTTNYRGVVGRFDVCTGAMLPLLDDDLPQPAADLRVLPGGDVLVTAQTRAVRYEPTGAVVSEWLIDDEYDFFSGVALDLDRRFVWLGTRWQLERVELETGQTVESVPTYGPAVSISITGEPRAARTQPKRRAVRR